MNSATVAALQALDGDECVIIVCSAEEWDKHMQRVIVCTSLLGSMMAALSANPMFSAFLPAELQTAIRAVNE